MASPIHLETAVKLKGELFEMEKSNADALELSKTELKTELQKMMATNEESCRNFTAAEEKIQQLETVKVVGLVEQISVLTEAVKKAQDRNLEQTKELQVEESKVEELVLEKEDLVKQVHEMETILRLV